MSIESSLRCSLQVALLGAITPNLRGINAAVINHDITLYFYYETVPNDEEQTLSEVVASEIISDFPDYSIQLKCEIFPLVKRMPEIGIRIFHRHE